MWDKDTTAITIIINDSLEEIVSFVTIKDAVMK